MNSITELFNLGDNDIILSNIETQRTTKILTVETIPITHHCAIKIHSNGIEIRTINHSLIEDSYKLHVKLN